jgi:hypothetical protein
MLLLTSTSDLVQVVTSATSGSGYGVEVQSSWLDNASGTITPGRTNTAITTATTTTVVGSPGSSTQRNVRLLSIRNDHATDSCLVEVRHTDGTVVVTLWKGTLLAGESIVLDQDGKWYRIAANGIPVPPGMSIVKVEDWTSSGTSTVPAGATHAINSGCGGGGGGGGGGERGSSGANAGSGGGGSPVHTTRPIPVTPGDTHTVTIGAGGTAGAGNTAGGNGADGGDGGDSTFGSLATFFGAAKGLGGSSAAQPSTTTALTGGLCLRQLGRQTLDGGNLWCRHAGEGGRSGTALGGSGADGMPSTSGYAGGTGGTAVANSTGGGGGGGGGFGAGGVGGSCANAAVKPSAPAAPAANTGGGGGGGAAANSNVDGGDAAAGGSGRIVAVYVRIVS